MTTAKNITFLGYWGTEERSEPLQWGGLTFEANKPVLVDPDAVEAAEMKRFYEYMIVKAKTHPALKIEDAPDPPAARKAKAKTKGRDDEDDGEDEENGNGDVSIPPGWRDMHWNRQIALARKLGADEDVNTREAAVVYIEEQIALGVPQKKPAPEFSL